MLTCYLQGGLGDQLFQVTTVLHYSRQCGATPYFVNRAFSGDLSSEVHCTYWNTIFSRIAPLLRMDYAHESIALHEHIPHIYNPLPLRLPLGKNIILTGGFQSPRYFSDGAITRNIFSRILDIEGQCAQLLERMCGMTLEYSQISHDITSTRDSYVIALHFQPDKLDYYLRALEQWFSHNGGQKSRLLCFYKASNASFLANFINAVEQREFALDITIITLEMSDWEQLLLASVCHACILDSSTFSWWTAFLNKRPTAYICCPDPWFTSGYIERQQNDLIPRPWVRIKT